MPACATIMTGKSDATLPMSPFVVGAGIIGLIVFPVYWALYSVSTIPGLREFLVDQHHQYWWQFQWAATGVELTTFVVMWALLRSGGVVWSDVSRPVSSPKQRVGWIACWCIAIVCITLVALHAPSRVPSAFFFYPSTLEQRLFFAFVTAPVAAIAEEFIFRGYGTTVLSRAFHSKAAGSVASSLLFAFMHGGWYQGALAFASRFVIGLIFSAVFIWRGSLRLPIFLHWLVDALMVAA